MSSRPPHPASRTRLRARAGVALVLALLLGACGRSPGPSGAVTLEAFRATSSTSFHLRFSVPVGAGADDPANYLLRDPDGIPLPVVGAHPSDDGYVVDLTTEPQRLVAYRVTVRNLQRKGGSPIAGELTFQQPVPGSDVPAPFPSRAVALSNTLVLVSFDDPGTTGPAAMTDDVLDPAAYAFDDTSLQVLSVAFSDDGADRSRVLLTTTSMADQDYRLTVGPATADPGPRPIDPFRDEVLFRGIAATDTVAPSVVEAFASDNTTVVLRFSEPVQDGASDPSRYRIEDGAGASLPVTSASVEGYATRVVLSTAAMVAGVDYTLTVANVLDKAGNATDPTVSVSFVGVVPGNDTTPPRVMGATSTGPTRVLVTFSEPVRGGADSAENPDHYQIVGSDSLAEDLAKQAVLVVTDADLANDGRSVLLTTLAQSEIAYTLRVSSVFDLSGNAVQGPTRENPYEIEFFGKPGDDTDCDADGLSDALEQRGWTVRVVQADGTAVTREVTSDPCVADTDGDGLTDLEERTYRTDPRVADTDDDGLTDTRELNEIYSEPSLADTDGDGLQDGLEVDGFGTSPLLADTDGDQLSDDYEVTTDNRHPRIADMPAVDITIGAVDLQLDVRFEERSAEGTSVIDSRSVATTLANSQESSTSRESTNTLEWFVQAGTSVCVKGGCEDGKNWGWEFHAEGGASGSQSTTFTNASVRASQREYASSLATDREVSAESEVTRVVEGATMAVEVGIANASNLSFTIQDIEITALIQDTNEPGTFVPVATLFAASNEPISIGPLDPARGPFRFVAQDAYPNLVESLMRNPRGLIFRIANKRITDEFGRDFAYVEQDVNDRTAFLEIDYAGNAPLERYQVATNAGFDADLRPTGVTLGHVLQEILGLEYVPEGEDVTLDPTDADDLERILSSYSTRTIAGVDTLWRVRGVSRELTGLERDWWVLGPEGNITPVGSRAGKDFRSYRVMSDQDFAFSFEQDLDQDDLSAQEETFYRSLDSDADVDPADGVPDSRDTDRDGIDDGDEVYGAAVGIRRIPWLVRLEDGRDAYVTQAHPGRADADGDGLTDCQEFVLDAACAAIPVYLDADGVPTLVADGTTYLMDVELRNPDGTPRRTDPANPDTDGDGIDDAREAIGFLYHDLQGAPVILRPDTDPTTPWATNPLHADTDQDGLADLAEVRLGSNPIQPDGDTVRDDDDDGLVNAVETIGWEVQLASGATRNVTSDPTDPDTDDDGLTDWEEYHGCRDANHDFRCDTAARFGPTDPSASDTDGDGLFDASEVDGVEFPGDSDTRLRFTEPLDFDTDDDGRSDGAEIGTSWMVEVAGRGGYRVWSDPLLADADGDGLNDATEFTLGTDPNAADSDGDGALDSLEATRPTDPLVPDHLVTVTYLSLQAGRGSTSSGADGDSDYTANPGDFWFWFGVRVPGASGVLVQRTVTTSATVPARTCTDGDDDLCRRQYNSSVAWIQIAAPRTFGMAESTQFALPFTRLFTVEATVQEIDLWGDGSTYADISWFFGGAADPSATFAGNALEKGSFLLNFSETYEGTPVDVVVQVTVE